MRHPLLLLVVALLTAFPDHAATAATCQSPPAALTDVQSAQLRRVTATITQQPVTAPAAIAARIERGDTYRLWGRYADAVADLTRALDAAQLAKQPLLTIAATQALGQVYAQQRQFDRAERHLRRAVTLAQQLDNAALQATAGNGLATVLAERQQPAAALAAYRVALTHAERVNDPALSASILLNLARLSGTSARPYLQRAQVAINRVTDTAERVALLLALAARAQDVGSDALALTSAQLAEQQAAQADLARLQAQALAQLAQLAAARGELNTAREQIARALQLVPLTAYDVRYQWEWQLGQWLRAAGERGRAIAAYQRAVNYLQRIRLDIPVEYAAGRSSFRDTFAPLYLGLADLLFQDAAATGDTPHRQRQLRLARDAVEQVKLDELRDYFHDLCLLPLREDVGTVAAHTAVLYPVLFAERLELLVSIGERFYQATLPVSRDEIQPVAEIMALKLRYDKPADDEAAQLYDWLITPVAGVLTAQHVTTLVFIPDGPLRPIPLAALRKNGRYAIEQFAIATVPGLRLLAPEATVATALPTLLAGLSRPGPVIDELPAWWVAAMVQQQRGRGNQRGVSVPVRGVADDAQRSLVTTNASQAEKIAALSLPGVAEEINQLSALLPANTLRDEQFLLKRFVTEVHDQSYRVVHIASHGLFQGPPEDNFIVTYDRKLDMKTLATALRPKQLAQRPIELLVLSACQTAEGDDRTPLGLSGVALQSGARSALGSLWPVSDAATQVLMQTFYDTLKQPGMTKGRALQAAQQALIANDKYNHPSDWAAFILVGSWF